MHKRIDKVLQQWSVSWRDALIASIGGAVAWLICQWMLGQPRPVFAMVTAVICLAPNLPNHGKQAIGVITGVTTGVVVGELSLLLPETIPVLHMSVVTCIAMVLATTFGLAPAIAIQSGVSAILVLAMGPQVAGMTRLIDVLVGAGVGLLFSQILATPDPVRLIDRAVRGLVDNILKGLKQSAIALEKQDVVHAQSAINQFTQAQRAVNALGDGIALARSNARWSLRGRLVAREVSEMAGRYDRRGIRLYASALLFGEALGNALRKKEASPAEWIAQSLQSVIHNCNLDEGETPERLPPVPQDIDFSWRDTAFRLQSVNETLLHFLHSAQPDSVPVRPPKPNADVPTV
ncbi:FUSC family protein [Brucella pseudogrignonensis]|uniref:FUSC family protein n=1 Tax=Brucella pseudogrignonensis TaxID=419475 RepID=UPI000DE37B27|nr:FUSC family protein [Brucella pseudogrignonensis]KAB2691025.1 aromatic acid exporter family protein [Brucella pseudogrignonensis]